MNDKTVLEENELNNKNNSQQEEAKLKEEPNKPDSETREEKRERYVKISLDEIGIGTGLIIESVNIRPMEILGLLDVARDSVKKDMAEKTITSSEDLIDKILKSALRARL